MESQSSVKHLVGCVGALYAIQSDIPFQAVVDACYWFISFSSVLCGSSHDSLAFNVWDLDNEMRAEGLSFGYWLSGDATYMYTNALLVSF